MAELQTMARNGQMSRLGSCYPNGGDEPNTSSSLPMQMHPGYGKSPQPTLCIGDCSSGPRRLLLSLYAAQVVCQNVRLSGLVHNHWLD